MAKEKDLGPMPLDVEDWFMSSVRNRMTLSERCIYLESLALQWRDGSIPDDPHVLASMVRASDIEMSTAFPAVRFRFLQVKKGRLANRKLALLRRSRLSTVERVSKQRSLAASEKWRRIRELHAGRNPARNADAMHPHFPPSGKEVFLTTPPGEDVSLPLPAFDVSGSQGKRSLPESTGAGEGQEFDPLPGWKIFERAFPQIRKRNLANQLWNSVCNSAEDEAAILAGVERYCESDEVARGVVTSAENWLRDRMWEGKFAPAKATKAEAVDRQIRDWRGKT